jgi:hypothetical protein
MRDLVIRAHLDKGPGQVLDQFVSAAAASLASAAR